MEANLVLTGDSIFLDKDALSRMLDEADARSSFVCDPTATPQKAREIMRAQGVRAEDNLFSRDIIRARYPDEFSQEDKE